MALTEFINVCTNELRIFDGKLLPLFICRLDKGRGKIDSNV